MENDRPDPDTYWVIPGRLLAGAYPGAMHAIDAMPKVERFVNHGVNFFLDLTQEYELRPYARFLKDEPQVVHRRMPIQDLGIPTEEEMCQILDQIDAALAEGHQVYVHCWGGIGRTGTVIGCWMVRHGRTGPDALETMNQMRQVLPERHRERRSPETQEQTRMVVGWKKGK